MPDTDRNQAVSLGCGTLILIALIVVFFSNRGNDDVKAEISSLRSEVGELRKAIDAQTAQLKAMRQEMPAPGDPIGERPE